MTDLQARLQHIQRRTDELRQSLSEADAGRYPAVTSDQVCETVKELCYLLGYVAKIVGKHLETNER